MGATTQAVAVVAPPVAPIVERAKNMLELAQEFEMIASLDESELPADSIQLDQETFRESLVENRQKCDKLGYYVEAVSIDIEARKLRIQREQEAITKNQRIIERLKSWTEFVIRTLGRDTKGKYKKLVGDVFTFNLKKAQNALEVEDQTVPTFYKRATVKFKSADVWERLVSGAVEAGAITPEEVAMECAVTYEVRKKDVRKAIESNIEVPGADLILDRYRLEGECFKAMKQKEEDE